MAELKAYKMIPHSAEKGTQVVYEMDELVRCKDCQFAEHTMYDDEYRCYFDEENESGCKRLHKGNHFCSDGKRV